MSEDAFLRPSSDDVRSDSFSMILLYSRVFRHFLFITLIMISKITRGEQSFCGQIRLYIVILALILYNEKLWKKKIRTTNL